MCRNAFTLVYKHERVKYYKFLKLSLGISLGKKHKTSTNFYGNLKNYGRLESFKCSFNSKFICFIFILQHNQNILLPMIWWVDIEYPVLQEICFNLLSFGNTILTMSHLSNPKSSCISPANYLILIGRPRFLMYIPHTSVRLLQSRMECLDGIVEGFWDICSISDAAQD